MDTIPPAAVVWPIVSFLLSSAVAGALAFLGAILLASTNFGERWFSAHLDAKVGSKIEELKSKLAHIGDRGIRSNEREYNAVIAAWESLNDAYDATSECIMSFVSHPDLERFSAEELTSFLNATDFSNLQKEEIRGLSPNNRNGGFSRVVQARGINRAAERNLNAKRVLERQGIFLPNELKLAIKGAIGFCKEAQVQRYVEFQHDGSTLQMKAVEKFLSDGPAALEAVEDLVRTRVYRD
ncbi:MAG: hypothetical protein ACKVRO_05040 [Micropepsaceae bacterium]